MSGPTPDADELAVKERLITLVDGPAPAPTQQALPPKPATRPRDWLDDLLDEPAEAPPAAAPIEQPSVKEPAAAKPPAPAASPEPKKPKAEPRRGRPRRRNSATPRSAWDTQPHDPRQSLIEAWDRIPYRLKWLAYHLAAAYAGLRLGIVTWSSNTAAWFAAGHWTSSSAWVLYVLGALVAALYRRSRPWAWPVAWLAAIPVSSVVIGLLLYGTDYMNLRIPL